MDAIDLNGHVKFSPMTSFGEFIREARISRRLLLREVAAKLRIDPSLLSRIERGEKRPTRDQVIQLASILKQDTDDLVIQYLSDKVVYELRGEKLAMKAMVAAEKKMNYKKRN
jgi:HTH-type transcriptional regulator, competence development regulator